MASKPVRRGRIIPYTSFSSSYHHDEWFHLVYCEHDKIYYIFSAVIERGLGDYEPIRCPTCFGSVAKIGGSNDSSISATNVPEAIACLIVPSKGKTLKLALLESVTEEKISDILRHLARLSTLKSFSQVEKRSKLQSFQRISELLRRKNSSNTSFIELSEHRKKEEKRLESDTLRVEQNEVSPSEVVAANRRLSSKYLERLREDWLNSQREIELRERVKPLLKSSEKSKRKASKSYSTRSLTQISSKLTELIDDSFVKQTICLGSLVCCLKLPAKAKRYRLVPLTEKKLEL